MDKSLGALLGTALTGTPRDPFSVIWHVSTFRQDVSRTESCEDSTCNAVQLARIPGFDLKKATRLKKDAFERLFRMGDALPARRAVSASVSTCDDRPNPRTVPARPSSTRGCGDTSKRMGWTFSGTSNSNSSPSPGPAPSHSNT